jgi:hypothetical protein
MNAHVMSAVVRSMMMHHTVRRGHAEQHRRPSSHRQFEKIGVLAFSGVS